MNLVIAEMIVVFALTAWAVASGQRTSRRVADVRREFSAAARQVAEERARLLTLAEIQEANTRAAALAHADLVARSLRGVDPEKTQVGV